MNREVTHHRFQIVVPDQHGLGAEDPSFGHTADVAQVAPIDQRYAHVIDYATKAVLLACLHLATEATDAVNFARSRLKRAY